MSLQHKREPGFSDQGSTLPILLAGVAFLVVLALTLVGAAQLLQQQRIVNSRTDSLALKLTQELADYNVSRKAVEPLDLESEARKSLREIFGVDSPLELHAVSVTSASVQVSYCEASRSGFGKLVGIGAAKVCAVSRAEAR